MRGQQELSSAAAAESPALGSGLGLASYSPGGVPALSHLGNLDSSQGLDHTQSRAVQANQLDRVGARAGLSGPVAVNAFPDLPFALPFTSNTGSSASASSW